MFIIYLEQILSGARPFLSYMYRVWYLKNRTIKLRVLANKKKSDISKFGSNNS